VHDIELPLGELRIARSNQAALRSVLQRGLELGKGIVQAQGATGKTLRSFSSRRACTNCGKGFADPDPQMFSYNSARGWCTECFGTGLRIEDFDAEQSGEEGAWEESEGHHVTCPACDGKRLNETALAVRFRDQSIAQLTALPVASLGVFLHKLKLDARETAIGQDLLTEIATRLEFLGRVGLSYLGLDRAAPTLSGGETQRLRLAAQLGSNLRGVCYVLDEPTIGLHPRDNLLLLDALTALAGGRNTLVVVEHDEETIRRADHLIDLGPGAGSRGGTVVGSGSVQDLMANPASITGRYLREPLRHPQVPRRPVVARGRNATPMLSVKDATLHNLQDLDVDFPLGRIIAMTGVSGSGKSTLARDVLYAELVGALASREKRKAPAYAPHNCTALSGIERIERVLEVDQTPIGRTPRSCPATYVGFWDAIRKLFAAASESAIRGYTASRFSFNTAEGRCASCEGQGIRTIGMSFLPDVKVLCDSCNGQRFDPETLSIQWRSKSIGDVLAMSVDEAVDFFASHSSIHHPLLLLQEVGLGYLTLGQQSPTLSGGEAQRIKLVTELARIRRNVDPRSADATSRGSFYVLDEPTVGLHMADVEKLIGVLHRLTDAGHTVLVIEHNLDVIAQADWVIDLGPEAGDEGGRIVATGTPADIARNKRSHTGRYLAQFLEQRHGA
jgi:excinuclease ABC subunit A